MQQDRPLHEIARDIQANWPSVNYAAKPYLSAMYSLASVTEKYGHDDAKSIVSYFLSNASTWRGDHARRIKAELRRMIT